jgi:hypothetical protein
MMKLADVIAKVNNLRPSEYDKEQMTEWINEIEFQVVTQVINMAKDENISFEPLEYNNDADRDLLIPDAFASVYTSYLIGKIDYMNGESDRYAMDLTDYEAKWQDFAAWYRRTHMPKPFRDKR